MDAIEVKGLVKTYGDMRAVDGIGFSVPEGSFFAFLGPNGAGKSTTISIICSLLEQDSGEVRIFGREVSDPTIRNDIGVVFQDPMLDPKLTVRENLEIRASMYGLKDVRSAVERAMADADCTEFSKQRYGTLSGGQRRRADIARALVHSPRVLILDEPTSGLDPHTRKVIWESVFRLNRQNNMTVLLTTHYMEEASNADDVIIIDRGNITVRGTPEQLKDTYSRDRMVLVAKDPEAMDKCLSDMGIAFSEARGTFTIELASTMDAIPIIQSVKDMMESFEVRTGTLDEAFVSITGGDE